MNPTSIPLTSPFYPRKSRCTLAARVIAAALAILASAQSALADSISSPNITLNVDTNRAAGSGAGAGDVAISINTVAIAELNVNEFSSGEGKAITLRVRPGYQFDPTSNITAQSATIGINGAAINTGTVLTPNGNADETLTFNFTSGTSGSQDIIRIDGIKLKILNAAGAAGPAQVTMEVDTLSVGGQFENQGIVAANITKGAPDRLIFSLQPGTSQSGAPLLPAVAIVDFGGNIITDNPREITLTLEDNPGAATLNGTSTLTTENGIAAWAEIDNLNIATPAEGYTLTATHDGAAFLTSDSVTSGAFDILAGPPNRLAFTVQPVDTVAGSPILLSVSVLDDGDNLVTDAPVDVTLDSATNPGGWPLLVDTSLTKTTENGVATWAAADNLRINKSVAGYKLTASGLSTPVESDTFDITPGEPDHINITNQPVNTLAGEDIQIAVTVFDEFNNINTESPVDVTLNLSTNPGGATLDVGTSLTKATENGVARWEAADDLRIDTPATGYRILASAVGPAIESDAFDIVSLVVEAQPANPCGVECGAGGAATLVPLLLIRWKWRRTTRRQHRPA